MAFPIIRVFLTTLLTGVMVGSALGAGPLSLVASPLFEGELSNPKVLPLMVEVANSGPDARGVLKVSADDKVVLYPIDLPRGSRKRLVTYPPGSLSSEVHCFLQTDQGKVDKTVAIRNRVVDGRNVLLFTDVPGEMAFLVDPHAVAQGGAGASGQQSAPTLVDCYCKPGDGPTRAIGYMGISTIVLGAGSERLTDGEVAAIRLWMTTGGTVCFVGGVSSPVLSDRRWADVIPIRNARLAELPHSAVLQGLGAGAVPTLSVTSGDPVEGGTAKMDGSILVWSDKPHGYGKAIYLSFNPFEAPMNTWDGRRVALTKILRSPETQASETFLSGYAGTFDLQSPPPSGVAPPAGGASGGVSMAISPSSIREDPFSMKLPPTIRIAGILFGYLILVVPVNFLVLKKMKRGEMAWITAPVISLAFATVLFQSSRSLYAAKMSTVSDGVVVAQEGDSEGIYYGYSQMFIPRAGSYDLGLSDVDSIGLSEDSGSGYGGYGSYDSSDENRDLEPVDVGEIKVPALQAHNLSFEKISYRQRVSLARGLHLRLTADGPDGAQCEVANTGSYELRQAQLAVGRTLKSIGDLKPGEHKSVSVSFVQPEKKKDDIGSFDIRLFTARRRRVALTGQLEGFRPGPQIGQDVPGRSGVQFVLFSAWNGEKP